jgi:c-di-GMP-binding flagellar brake protein YcgR
MENRREHYRHEFAPTRRFLVRLEAATIEATLQAELVNLSVGGMCVYAPSLKANAPEDWRIMLPLQAGAEPLTIAAKRIHKRSDGGCCGFRFLDVTEERDKAIWQFLLAEQRRRRQFKHGG